MLDFEKVKTASPTEQMVIGLCEFSRMVDALERLAAAVDRMAPTMEDLEAAKADAAAPPATTDATLPKCPHPVELRTSVATMGDGLMAKFVCGICKEVVTQQPVEV